MKKLNFLFAILQLGTLIAKLFVPEIYSWFITLLPALFYAGMILMIWLIIWIACGLDEYYGPSKSEGEY